MDNLYETYAGPKLAPQEMHEAWDETRDELMKPVDELAEMFFGMCERVTDQQEAMKSFVLGDWIAEKHCKDLDKQADECEADGRTLAADHYRKRELTFAMWTLGYNHEVTTRVRNELQERDRKTPPAFGAPIQHPTPYAPPPSQRFDFGVPRK